MFCICFVFSKVNESRRATENYEKVWRIFTQIDKLPPNVRSGSRQLLRECTVLCLGGTDQWATFLKRQLRLFVFNDVLLVGGLFTVFKYFLHQSPWAPCHVVTA